MDAFFKVDINAITSFCFLLFVLKNRLFAIAKNYSNKLESLEKIGDKCNPEQGGEMFRKFS